MIGLILLFALLMLVAGIILLIKPAIVFDFINGNANSASLYRAAIIIRLVLGILLIYLADLSRYPGAVHFIGWVAIIAAVMLILMERQNFARLLELLIPRITPWGRITGLAALLFGFFLLYAFV